MPVTIHEIRDPRIASFIARIDQSRGAHTDGKLDRREAVMASQRIARYPHWRQAAEDESPDRDGGRLRARGNRAWRAPERYDGQGIPIRRKP